jgi:sugar phosphate isomerase/epimerase
MDARVMVCHLRPDDPSERTVAEMLDALEGSSLKLAVENGQDLRDYVALVDRIGSDRFGMIVDVGHTRDPDGANPFTKAERARRTMAQCGGRLISLHLHDFLEPEWDHLAPLDGVIQWDEVIGAFRDIDYQGMFTFEAIFEGAERGKYAPEYILSKTAEFPEAFVRRYGDA